jgi:hypothetical protein
MNYIYTFIMALVMFAMLTVQPVSAASVAGNSATISADALGKAETVGVLKPVTGSEYATKKIVIKRVLERYGSPMADTVDDFIASCVKYDLNCYLLPSIAGVESGFGRAMIDGTHNAFGWGGGYIYFDSWADAYDTIGKGLRERYIDRGATDIASVGDIYAESPTWPQKVSYWMSVFEAEERNVLQLKDGEVQ